MKPFFCFSVLSIVLTYIKDVFDGTSPYWGRSRFLYCQQSHIPAHPHTPNPINS